MTFTDAVRTAREKRVSLYHPMTDKVPYPIKMSAWLFVEESKTLVSSMTQWSLNIAAILSDKWEVGVSCPTCKQEICK